MLDQPRHSFPAFAGQPQPLPQNGFPNQSPFSNVFNQPTSAAGAFGTGQPGFGTPSQPSGYGTQNILGTAPAPSQNMFTTPPLFGQPAPNGTFGTQGHFSTQPSFATLSQPPPPGFGTNLNHFSPVQNAQQPTFGHFPSPNNNPSGFGTNHFTPQNTQPAFGFGNPIPFGGYNTPPSPFNPASPPQHFTTSQYNQQPNMFGTATPPRDPNPFKNMFGSPPPPQPTFFRHSSGAPNPFQTNPGPFPPGNPFQPPHAYGHSGAF